jgi:ribosomal-protein-alanine N-acetyltransferase
MSKRKTAAEKKPRKPKLCPDCQGQGVIIEECMNCMGFRCLECDGQGYLIFDCETCREKRVKENAKTKKKADKWAAKKAMKKEIQQKGKITFERSGVTFTYVSEADLPDIIVMLAKNSVCEFVFFGPNTEQETRAYFEPLVESIQTALAKGERPAEHVFTIRRDGQFLGQCALLPVAFSLDNYLIGFTIDDAHWRQGNGTIACRFLIDFAFMVLNARRISSDCMEGNIGSRKIMENCGFQFEGTQKQYWNKNGQIFDNLLFGLLKGQSPVKKVTKKQ